MEDKSLLVIDTPERCDKCPLFESVLCRQLGASRIKNIRKELCPLFYVPQKYEEKGPADTWENVYAKGWNACVDEILRFEIIKKTE